MLHWPSCSFKAHYRKSNRKEDIHNARSHKLFLHRTVDGMCCVFTTLKKKVSLQMRNLRRDAISHTFYAMFSTCIGFALNTEHGMINKIAQKWEMSKKLE